MAGGAEGGHRPEGREECNLHPTVTSPAGSRQYQVSLDRNLASGPPAIPNPSPNPSLVRSTPAPHWLQRPTPPPASTPASPRLQLCSGSPNPKPILPYHGDPIPNVTLTPGRPSLSIVLLPHVTHSCHPQLLTPNPILICTFTSPLSSGSPRFGIGVGRGLVPRPNWDPQPRGLSRWGTGLLHPLLLAGKGPVSLGWEVRGERSGEALAWDFLLISWL